MISVKCAWTFRTQVWLVVAVAMAVVEVMALNGANVCMVKQKYNITKRIKYRAPMSVRTYEWCFSMPPRCSRWTIEMRDLTRLETEERTAEVAVCCPGYKMRDVSCVPICPNGKMGSGCSEDCPPNRWGPNCVHDCQVCEHGECSPSTGECVCHRGWQGESCDSLSTTTTSTTPAGDILTTSKATKLSAPSNTAFTLITTSSTTTTTTTTTIPAVPPPTKPPTQPTTLATERIPIRPQILLSNKKPEITTTNLPIQPTKQMSTYRYMPDVEKQTTYGTFTEETTQSIVEKSSIYNRTEIPVTKSTYQTETTALTTQPTTKKANNLKSKTIDKVERNITTTATIEAVKPTVPLIIKEVQTTVTAKVETTRKAETTIKLIPTTIKFKPKEIWIRPAQKGESPVTEIKTKLNQDVPVKHKNATKIEILPNTTPKTIIVSIIPTSVSYATFKKIALTTASYLSNKNVTSVRAYSKSDGITKPMSVPTSTVIPSLKKYNNTSLKSIHFTTTLSSLSAKIVSNATPPPNITTITSTAQPSTLATRRSSPIKPIFVNNITNSMSRTTNAVTTKTKISSNTLTTITIPSTNSTQLPKKRNATIEKTVPKLIATTEKIVTVGSLSRNLDKRNLTTRMTTVETTTRKVVRTNVTKNVSKTANSTNLSVTDKPQDEETFQILTEPEHITAVMSEKGTERSSVDLISVISIAGGVMMAVITVAVIIVMVERCKRPRYEDVRKMNDIRMQVLIDNNDVPPPPYVRSIFHTPLPDPPMLEKCHYQPISTLDRNLKQFMRPVVVQTISPIMLENFRGILECHYDHLPRRSHEFEAQQTRCLITPSIEDSKQHHIQRASLTESAIEAMKCEAKLDVIDTTTSEPLYAEIPCWRPPSEHAVEIINLNGEAVTEL